MLLLISVFIRTGWCIFHRLQTAPPCVRNISLLIKQLLSFGYFILHKLNPLSSSVYYNHLWITTKNLKTGRKFDTMALELITPHKNRLNRNGDGENHFSYNCGKTTAEFNVTETCHHIKFIGVCKGKKIVAEFFCSRLPHHESITIAVPFKKTGHFFTSPILWQIPS